LGFIHKNMRNLQSFWGGRNETAFSILQKINYTCDQYGNSITQQLDFIVITVNTHDIYNFYLLREP